MGTTNEIKSTNIGQSLIGKTCQGCEKKFTEKDICENNNWEIEFDTSNDVNLVDNEKGGYNLTIWIRNAYHEYCDEAEASTEKEKKTAWQELGERIKNSNPVESLLESQRRHAELKKWEK